MFSRKNLVCEIFKSLSIKTNHNFRNVNQVKNNSTFHKQTLDYFRNQPHYNKFVLKQSMIEDNNSVNNFVQLNSISTDELLIRFSSSRFKPLLYEIDNELVCRVNVMSINQILALMDACLSENNFLSKNARSFIKCIELLDESWFRRPDLTASQTIQLIYYVSIYKNKSKPVVELGLQKLLNEINYLKHLTDNELSALAVATYKSTSKVYDKILRIFAFRIEKNINNLMQNPMHLVSLIKPLKKSKYHDPILLTKLITTFNNNTNNKVLIDVISSIHILSYFADANCNQVTFLQSLVDSIGNTMIKDSLKNYRIKDISNYVFSTSYLGLTPKDPNVCKIIIDFLDKMFNTKEKCKKYSKVLIGMCLSMWMLDYKPTKLLQFMFSDNMSIAALRMPNAHKQDNRINLLLACLSIEQPDLITKCELNAEKYSMPLVNTHLGERPFLVKVYQTLQESSNKLDISKIEYNFSIPYLKILGIKVIKKNSTIIYVEVLDNSTCLYDTSIPNGMMKLKFRLESKLNFIVITVNHKDIGLNNQMLLKSHLESSLS